MANICKQIPFCEIYEKDPEYKGGERCICHLCDKAPAYSKKWAGQRVQPPIICSKLNFCEDGAIAKCDGRDTACDTYLSEVEDTNKESKLASQSKRVHNLQQQQKIEDDQVFSKVSWISKVNKEVTDLVALISEKQEAYGDSFGQSGKIIEVLYPDGIKPEQYKDALTIIRIIDKLFRIANKKNAFGETPWRDITGYALLSLIRDIDEDEIDINLEELMRDAYRI